MLLLSELNDSFLKSIKVGAKFELFCQKYDSIPKLTQMLKQMVHRATGNKLPMFKIVAIENGYDVTCIGIKPAKPYKIPVTNPNRFPYISKITAEGVHLILNNIDPLLYTEISTSDETRIRFEYTPSGNNKQKLIAAIKRFIYAIPQKPSMAIVKVFTYEDNGTTRFVIKRRKRIQLV